MAEAMTDGVSSDEVLWCCDCAQCALSTEQHTDHDTSFQTASNLADYRDAAHAMIYAVDDRVLFDKYKMTANIMMQMRFDGVFGFPGGFVDPTDQSIVDGLNRELVEEINFDVDKHKLTQNDFVMSCICSYRKLVTHFYAIEVTSAQYQDIEKRVFAAHDWGSETLGVMRVPLHTMEDGERGFPLFLAGKFIGNSKKQLIHTIIKRKIMSAEAVEQALQRAMQLTS